MDHFHKNPVPEFVRPCRERRVPFSDSWQSADQHLSLRVAFDNSELRDPIPIFEPPIFRFEERHVDLYETWMLHLI